MSLRLNTTTDGAFAEILLHSLPNENRRKVVRKEVKNNTYGHELVLFCSCFPLLCVHYSSEVSMFLPFAFAFFLYRVDVATSVFRPSTSIDR